ncbi:Early nodulin-like protein 1 [Nymphaea thermarum]|nr:Early nodulin-like protein 1 [Nymphaea thermarum]
MAGIAKRVNHMLLLVGVLACLGEAYAREFQVGGSQGWTVPKDTSTNPYNQWAEKNRFQIGDSLLFVYQSSSDSVLQVSRDDYNNCNTATPIAAFNDGRTTFTFNRSGSFYFISGAEDNCKKNEKLVVVVLSDRTKQTPTTSPATSPPTTSPSPSGKSPSYNGVLSSTVGKASAIFGALVGPAILMAL